MGTRFRSVRRESGVGWNSVYAMTHQDEFIAAVVLFNIVTWPYSGTKSVWNCAVTHAITNLLLGRYVNGFGAPELW